MFNPEESFTKSLISCITAEGKRSLSTKRFGLLSGLPCLAQSPLTLEFLTYIVIPGCSILGFKALRNAISLENDTLVQQLKNDQPVMLLSLPNSEFLIWDEDSPDAEIPGENEISDWMVIKEYLYPEINTKYTHWICLEKSAKNEPIHESILKLLLTSVAYASAYPKRLPTSAQPETAALLLQLAGSASTAYSVRLRRSSKAFENGDVSEGFSHLRDAVLREMKLPHQVQTALMSPLDVKLTGEQTQELIYLARAGTMEMKILSTARLGHVQHVREIENTLSQLQMDYNAWVRAAVRDNGFL